MNSIAQTPIALTDRPSGLSDVSLMAKVGQEMAGIITTTTLHHCEMLKALNSRMDMLTELDRNLHDVAQRNGHQGEKTAEHFQVQMEMNFIDVQIVRAEKFHAALEAGIVSLKESVNG